MPSPLLTKHFRSCALAFCNSSSFFAVPIAQLRHMHAQVLRRLRIGHASLLDQAHSLKLELAGKLPSLMTYLRLHLTRCLRTRMQANQIYFRDDGPGLSASSTLCKKQTFSLSQLKRL